jgi:hypothetical protein
MQRDISRAKLRALLLQHFQWLYLSRARIQDFTIDEITGHD